MPSDLPYVPGVAHRFLDLPTGVRVHLAEAGRPGGEPVLLLHGWPQHWYVWRDVIPRLADRYRVLAPDLRGFGWSGQPHDGDFTKERLADDALALLDALELERVHLAGHDWGGWAGFLLALRAPERLRRFLALNIVQPWQPARRLLGSAWRLGYQNVLAAPGLGPRVIADGRYVRSLLRRGWGDEATWREDEMAHFVERLREPARARASSALYAQFQRRELVALLRGRYAGAHLRVPTRVLFGRDDFALAPRLLRGLRASADYAEIELVDRCGHWIVDERPQLVAERARAWFT